MQLNFKRSGWCRLDPCDLGLPVVVASYHAWDEGKLINGYEEMDSPLDKKRATKMLVTANWAMLKNTLVLLLNCLSPKTVSICLKTTIISRPYLILMYNIKTFLWAVSEELLQTDGHRDRRTDRQMDTQTDGHTHRRTDRRTHRQMDTHTDGQTDGHTDRWTHRQTDTHTNKTHSKEGRQQPSINHWSSFYIPLSVIYNCLSLCYNQILFLLRSLVWRHLGVTETLLFSQ